ncbi:MAG: helix-turn-helix transcriptional regulator [Chloroflexi bacterium HGW-Chloroflexi-8]|nr:MAG: helix-turn-helix transcriptional regulator [Chloroflexi bacterium HGW-Chloroflexi-8]
MPEQLLLTKFYVPILRPKIVLRPRLIELLNEGLSSGHKLTLISAPAGFGKTTLVSEWVASCGWPVAWLSLDEGDNDPNRFLSYFIAALQTIETNIGAGVLSVLQSPQPPPPAVSLTNLLNEISAIPDNFTLVLDDYHMIDSDPIDLALTFLLDHLPPQMHLVITTREDPSLPLSRFRARGQLTELRAADLRFTPEEASAFLNLVMKLNLSAGDIVALETRTEGWIAGLQLAALALLAMQSREDATSFIHSFTGSHRFVLDYLVEEVLLHQSEQIRSFLLQTAILERLCASLCNAVNMREDGNEMLNILEHNNLFLIPLDEKRQWYRYHHLFAEVLQTHLMGAQPEQVAALHQRASVWYEQNSLRSDSIRHALAAKDLDCAAGLIELAWPGAEEGTIQQAVWLGWVKKLPDEMFHTRPVLNVDYAYALLGIGEIEAAEKRFKDTERWLNPETGSPGMIVVDMEQYKSLQETIAIGRAYIAQAIGNIKETIKYTSQVLELVPEGNAFRREQASMMLGMTYWATGDLEAAERVFADHTLRLRKAGNITDAISSTVVLADIRMALGHLQEAISTCEQLMQFVMEHGEPISPETADLHRELSDLYLEQLNLEVAAHHLQKSKELGEKAEMPVWRYRWRFSQARFKATQDNLDGALELLNEAEKLHIRTPLPDSFPISAMKARIWVAQGRLSKALEWVNGQKLSVDDSLSFLREFDHITLARILIAQYQNDRNEDTSHEAMRFLDRLLQAAEKGNRMGSVIEILVLQALAHQIQGNFKSALAPLKRALTLAEPEDYVRIFVAEGKPMVALLTRIEVEVKSRHIIEFIHKLISAYEMHKEIHPFGNITEGKNKSPITTGRNDGHQSLIETLSERELEVLNLLRTDLNGPEIARQCMVSLSTMRTHTQNIYAKLGVNNRRAAVRRAEELDLF